MADLPWEKYQQGPWAKYATPEAESFDSLAAQAQKQESETFRTGIRGAQVVGTGVAKGATEAMGVPATILGMGGPSPELVIKMADWARRQFGAPPIPEENKKEYQRTAGSMRVEPEKGLKAGLEKIGIPTEPETEAKRLGVPYEGTVKALTQGARFGTAAALTGAGPVLAAGSAVGAGAGEAIGGELGAALGSILGGVGALKIASRASGPTADVLFDKAKQLYTTAQNTPPMTAAQMNALDQNLTTFLSSTRRTGSTFPAFDPAAHPGTANALVAVKEYVGKPSVTIPEFLTLRDRVRDGFTGASQKDRLLLSQVLDRLESFLPSQVKAGDSAFRAASRSEAITELQKLADRSPSESVGALRMELRKLLNSKSRMRYFTEDEANRLETIISDPTFNVLRRAGAYSPTRGPVSLGVDLMPAIATGGLKEGVIASSVMAAGGEAARRAAGIMLRSRLKNFADEIRNARTAPNYNSLVRLVPSTLAEQNSGGVE